MSLTDEKTKDELLAMAEEVGAPATSSMKKDEIAAAIEEVLADEVPAEVQPREDITRITDGRPSQSYRVPERAEVVEPTEVAPATVPFTPNNTWTAYYGKKQYSFVEGRTVQLPPEVAAWFSRS